MTIGQIARRAGTPQTTIRYYERLGLLPQPPRSSGQRRYDETVLQRLAVIRFATYVGFSLTEVAQLLSGKHVRPPTDRWRQMAHARIQDLDAAIEHASMLKRMVTDTLSQTCPKLVERGAALNAGPERMAPSRRGSTSTTIGGERCFVKP